jgi:hypothetical protein
LEQVDLISLEGIWEIQPNEEKVNVTTASQNITIALCSGRSFKPGHVISVGVPRPLQTIKLRTLKLLKDQ